MADGYEPRPMDGYIYKSFADTHHANISQVEYGSYEILGRIVIIRLSFTVETLITDNTAVLFSGLPKSTIVQRFRVPPVTMANLPVLRLAIDQYGNISNQWSTINGVEGIPVGRYEGQGVYICA